MTGVDIEAFNWNAVSTPCHRAQTAEFAVIGSRQQGQILLPPKAAFGRNQRGTLLADLDCVVSVF